MPVHSESEYATEQDYEHEHEHGRVVSHSLSAIPSLIVGRCLRPHVISDVIPCRTEVSRYVTVRQRFERLDSAPIASNGDMKEWVVFIDRPQ